MRSASRVRISKASNNSALLVSNKSTSGPENLTKRSGSSRSGCVCWPSTISNDSSNPVFRIVLLKNSSIRGPVAETIYLLSSTRFYLSFSLHRCFGRGHRHRRRRHRTIDQPLLHDTYQITGQPV